MIQRWKIDSRMVQVRPPVSEGARVAEDLSEEVSIVGKPQRRMHAHGWQ